MKTQPPIGASIQVCPNVTLGRSAPRPKVFSSPTKAIVSGFGFLLLLGLSGPANGLPAQQFRPDIVAPKQEKAKVILNDRPTSNNLSNESSLIERIVLLPVRLGRNVVSALFHRKANGSPISIS